MLLCASHNDLGLLAALTKLGCEIVVTGNVAHQPGERYADRYIPADYSDKERILAIARAENIDGIVPCCNDFGVYTAAYVAEQLGLPGYDRYETTLAVNNKDRFKALAKELGILTPPTAMFDDPAAAETYAQASAPYPLIVKPVDCSAGNGIHRADTPEEAVPFLRQAFAASRAGRIVIEPFLTGTQHGFCTYLIDQKVVAVCSNNEYSFENPYRVEIDTFPSDTFGAAKSLLIEEIERIARHLHLVDGIFHLQYIFSDGKPYIIECMRRVLGNMYHVPGNRLTNLDWEYWEARARLGLPLAAFPRGTVQEGNFAYKVVLAPRDGVIARIRFPEEHAKHIFDAFWLRRPGDAVERHLSQPVGILFYRFATHEDMMETLIDGYHSDLVTMQDEDA